jgi:hypothetical protein
MARSVVSAIRNWFGGELPREAAQSSDLVRAGFEGLNLLQVGALMWLDYVPTQARSTI